MAGRHPDKPVDISNYVTGVNRLFANPNIAHLWSPYTAAGRAALNAMVTDQAQIIAYIAQLMTRIAA
jgi:DHA2 family multidrug resistance protein